MRPKVAANCRQIHAVLLSRSTAALGGHRYSFASYSPGGCRQPDIIQALNLNPVFAFGYFVQLGCRPLQNRYSGARPVIAAGRPQVFGSCFQDDTFSLAANYLIASILILLTVPILVPLNHLSY